MISDLRHACRMILKNPLMAIVVVLSLGVGIGANTVVFSWIEAVIFKPIPGVRDAGAFHLIEPRTDTGIYVGTSWPEYRDLHDRLHTMTDLIAFRMAPLYVGESGKVERGNGLFVSGNYFSALGLKPALGRLLRSQDAEHQVSDPDRRDLVRLLAHAVRRDERRDWPDHARERTGADDRRGRAERIPGHDSPADVRHVAAGTALDGAVRRLARTGRSVDPQLLGPRAGGVPGQRCRRAGRGDGGDAGSGQDVPANQHDGPSRRPVVLAGAARAAASARHVGGPVTGDYLASPAGRLRQYGQPRAGACERETTGDGRPDLAGCETLAYRAAAPYRKPRACPGRRRIGSRHRRLGNARTELAAADARPGNSHLVPDRRGQVRVWPSRCCWALAARLSSAWRRRSNSHVWRHSASARPPARNPAAGCGTC